MAMDLVQSVTWQRSRCPSGTAATACLQALFSDAAMTTKVFLLSGGLVGLGRGDLSLISQLGSMVDNKFSYCLVSRTDSPSQTSPLIFGDSASLNGAKTIPFIKNNASSSFRYIPLTGITINGKAVDIPAGTFDLGSDGSGGMIIDSGTTQAAYDPVKEAIQSAINMTPAAGSPAGFDLCYQKSSDVTLPTAIFNFRGGMDYELPGDNLFIQASDTLMCLAMGGTRGSLSIFGNVQQQNFHILYDNAQNSVSFMPAKCSILCNTLISMLIFFLRLISSSLCVFCTA